MTSTFGKLDVPAALRIGFLEIIFVFLFIDLFDNLGTLVAVGKKANLFDETHRIPRINRILVVGRRGDRGGLARGHLHRRQLHRKRRGSGCRWPHWHPGDRHRRAVSRWRSSWRLWWARSLPPRRRRRLSWSAA